MAPGAIATRRERCTGVKPSATRNASVPAASAAVWERTASVSTGGRPVAPSASVCGSAPATPGTRASLANRAFRAVVGMAPAACASAASPRRAATSARPMPRRRSAAAVSTYSHSRRGCTDEA